jgi:hypothetical protein
MKEEHTTQVNKSFTLSGADVLALLQSHTGDHIPHNARIFFKAPGWYDCNECELDFKNDEAVTIEYTINVPSEPDTFWDWINE